MKAIILLPDGAGVRNFLYTNFLQEAKASGMEVSVMADKLLLTAIPYNNIQKIELPTSKATSNSIEVYKKAWEISLLKHQAKKWNDPVYLTYILNKKKSGIRQHIKSLLEKCVIATHKHSAKKIEILKEKYIQETKKLSYYNECKTILQNEKPDIIFCTHQRALNAIAPLLAAQELGIKNVCFIYSWDNVPKATLFVKADHYLVWSDLMKKELMYYHSEVMADKIHITGTPQFIPYKNQALKISREEFATQYSLPLNKTWVCYSGDDKATSPYDEHYLYDFAKAIKQWNENNDEQLHIIFRRCPADYSARYNAVLEEYKNLITAIDPIWKTLQEGNWSSILAQPQDIALLVNTAQHCAFVVNLGSTMAFDFVIENKPCIYLQYNIVENTTWNINVSYRFVHFRSMHNLQPVIWASNKNNWNEYINEALHNGKQYVEDCTQWHQRIAQYPLEKANQRIIDALIEIKNK